MIVASIPDIDYLINALRPRVNGQTFRMTHSLVGALLLPLVTLLVLWTLAKLRHTPSHRSLRAAGSQLVLAGLSHLGLDLMTGVSSLPLLFPFNNTLFKLPFGLLPSAGRIQLDNFFLYRNLLIELGVLIPIAVSLFIGFKSVRTKPTLFAIVASLLVSSCFMTWAFSLSR
ncbi:MAG: metal-dependent hydrolase [Cyanobacteria bacterium J06635_15]